MQVLRHGQFGWMRTAAIGRVFLWPELAASVTAHKKIAITTKNDKINGKRIPCVSIKEEPVKKLWRRKVNGG